MREIETMPSSGISMNKFGSLPALPEVTAQILASLEDPNCNPRDLARLVSSDVALSARILRVVNSVFYGLPRQISTIDRAVVVLGRNAVRNVTIAASMNKLFNTTSRITTTQFNLRSLWAHSSATAVAAQLISHEIKQGDPSELFLAGLTHDIGIMAEMYWSHEMLFNCLNSLTFSPDGHPEQDLRVLEAQAFGFDHERIGLEACNHWNFPQCIATVAGYHHSPLQVSEEHQFLTSVVYVADRITAVLPGSFRFDLPSVEIDREILDGIDLPMELLPAIGEKVATELKNGTLDLS